MSEISIFLSPFIFLFVAEIIQVIFSYKFCKCADCGTKKNLIISRYTFTSFLNKVKPVEWRCNYHYRKYHNVTTDDFTTELDDKETIELRKLSNTL